MKGMATGESQIAKRFTIARKWQWPAAIASVLFVLSCFIGSPLGYLWPSAIGLALFIPAVMLFNIRCDTCGYPAFQNYQADEQLKLDNRFWTRFGGKGYGGVHLPLRSECSRCGARFVMDDSQAL